MKKLLLAGIIALIMSGAAQNAQTQTWTQTWQIGYPNAADVTATLKLNGENSSSGTLTISGTGAIKDFPSGGAPWSLNYDISGLVIQQGITSIGSYAFYNTFLWDNLTIPNSVTSIGAHAFEGLNSPVNNNLSLSIPSSVVSIGSQAFSGCNFNYEVDPANPSYSSADGVLFDKKKTTLISFPVAKSGDYTIPNSVTSIREYAFFRSGNNLTSLTMSNSVTSIGDYAFGGSYIKKITLSDHLTDIGNYAFDNSTLNYIKLPKSVTNIGGSAFYLYCLKNLEVEWDRPLAITNSVFVVNDYSVELIL